MTATPDTLTVPLYTVSEAASYLGVSRSAFLSWVNGTSVSVPGQPSGMVGRSMVTTVEGSRLTVPFVGLVEGLVVAAFRETGLAMLRVRPGLQRLAEENGLDHPLASEHLVTNGAAVLYDFARRTNDKQLALLTVVRNGHRVFHDVIQNYLDRIEYEDGWAARIVLPTTDEPVLVADPRRAFGQPIFRRGGARVVDVKDRIEAGEPVADVADDYGVSLADVLAALGSPSFAARAA